MFKKISWAGSKTHLLIDSDFTEKVEFKGASGYVDSIINTYTSKNIDPVPNLFLFIVYQFIPDASIYLRTDVNFNAALTIMFISIETIYVRGDGSDHYIIDSNFVATVKNSKSYCNSIIDEYSKRNINVAKNLYLFITKQFIHCAQCADFNYAIKILTQVHPNKLYNYIPELNAIHEKFKLL